jgi:hypothetical protein
MVLQGLKTVKLITVFLFRQNTTLRKLSIRLLLHVSAIITHHQADFAAKYTERSALLETLLEVKQPLYRPGQTLRAPGG